VDLNFIRGQFTESQLEEAIISLFQAQNYGYIHGETIHRGFDEILLKDDMKEYLSEHYPDLTVVETEKIIGRSINANNTRVLIV